MKLAKGHGPRGALRARRPEAQIFLRRVGDHAAIMQAEGIGLDRRKKVNAGPVIPIVSLVIF